VTPTVVSPYVTALHRSVTLEETLRGQDLRLQLDRQFKNAPSGIQAWDHISHSELWYGGDQIEDSDTLSSLGVESGARILYKPGTRERRCANVDYEDGEEKPAIVIDNGSGMIKAGCSGEDAPKTFSSIVGYPKQVCGLVSGREKDYYIGEEASQKRGILRIRNPLEHGIVQNWEDMERIWRHTFDNELRMVVGDECEVDEDCTGVLHTEAPMNPKEKRERMTQIMFETFQARRFFVATQQVLALYASGRTTGVVVDCGDGVSHTVPIYEGYSIPHAIQRINLAGRDLTDYFLQESKISIIFEIAKKIKEDLCYCSMNFAEEVDAFVGKQNQFEMPSGDVITVHNQLIRCPEVMFKPSLNNKEMMGLHELTMKTVNDCHGTLHNHLLGNVVMSGGTTMFPNMPERLQAELQGLVPQTTVDVIAPPERMISVWIGGSILASLSTFSRMWINQISDPDASSPVVGYEEVGPRIVHQMCTL